MIDVHASSYCAGETKNNKKCQISNVAGRPIFSKTAFVLEVFTPERYLMETLIFFLSDLIVLFQEPAETKGLH